ncbi:MAG: hypothetical protein HXY20_14825 [Acidobacteria bacterium]|nr:hypothetical protein [Acidobacteriota bacterium]
MPHTVGARPSSAADVIDIAARLELFVDHYLIDAFQGTRLRLHEPRAAGTGLAFDRPWEGAFSGYVTVMYDGSLYRMYYRGLRTAGKDGSELESTCYAESRDGIHWVKPDLGLHEVLGSRLNNVILHRSSSFSHNFSPFLDKRPGVDASERFKALAGTSKTGLYVFVSADGIRWKKWKDEPVVREGAFDSQNVAFWSEAEKCYAAYFRTWTGGDFKGFRTISRATSPDLLNWSAPVMMTFGDTPPEHLYTNQTQPYFRAPHICLALPMRFVPGCKVLTDDEARMLGVSQGYASDCAETVFMTSRGGNRYERTFMEGFIRPGLDPGNWASRSGLSALGVVPTGPAEISIYKQAHYAQPSNRLERYALRTDGFVSVHAPSAGGEMRTRPVRFAGKRLVVNFSTGAAGGVRVEIQDEQGRPVPGYSLEDCIPLVGDAIERTVTWKRGSGVGALAGLPVRVRFVMKDADLYAIRFRE